MLKGEYHMTWLQSFFQMFCSWSISDKIASINCFLTGLFLLATVVSVVCAFKAYNHQKERARKEAACDLAKYYAENIIKRYGFVTLVMISSGLESRVKELFRYKELSEFNYSEMLSFIEKKELSYDDVRESFENVDPQAVLDARILFSSSQERGDIIREYIAPSTDGSEKRINNPGLLQSEFLKEVSDFLNDLEWFSMSCRYGISDEELLYQSLHTTFLSTIWSLYFYICNNNSTNEDKLYTNVIWLFKKWRKRLFKIQKKAEAKRSKAHKKMESAERMHREAENELKKAKTIVHSGKPLHK